MLKVLKFPGLKVLGQGVDLSAVRSLASGSVLNTEDCELWLQNLKASRYINTSSMMLVKLEGDSMKPTFVDGSFEAEAVYGCGILQLLRPSFGGCLVAEMIQSRRERIADCWAASPPVASISYRETSPIRAFQHLIFNPNNPTGSFITHAEN
jgi:hypothetical protein